MRREEPRSDRDPAGTPAITMSAWRDLFHPTRLCDDEKTARHWGSVTCTDCGKQRGFVHACRPKSDFKARKRKQATSERQRKRKATRERQAARRRQAAAERRAREKARKDAARKCRPRPRQPQHDYATCTDRDCTRHPCVAYRQGLEDCPLPHGG